MIDILECFVARKREGNSKLRSLQTTLEPPELTN